MHSGLLLLLLSLSPVTEQYVEVPLESHKQVYALPPELDVVMVTDSSAILCLIDNEGVRLRSSGFDFRPLTRHPWLHSLLPYYHTYAEVCSIIEAVVTSRPDLCRLDTIGYTVRNRPIQAVRVTDNPSLEEPEPEFRIIGAHHGDEKISTEVALWLLHRLVQDYDTSAVVQRLVDEREVWIIPVLNVDGHIADTRSNSNGVDLNRDYGYKWYGSGRSPSPFSQPESRAVRDHGLANNITIEFAFHSSASYVNYLWDNHPSDPPDSAFLIDLARRYADSTHGSRTTELEPINGYDWYVVYGSCQDAGFGTRGVLSYTIENRQESNQSQIDSICIANTRALLALLDACGTGIRGTVVDSVTGRPLPARIAFNEPERWPAFTDPLLGDYHRPLSPGTYSLAVQSPGYRPASAVAVIDTSGPVTVDFALAPDTSPVHSMFELTWLVHADPRRVTADRSYDCLGPPDSRAFSLGRTGDVCLSAFSDTIIDLPGDDITIHDHDTVPDGYWLYASDRWDGPWDALGPGHGTSTFDLQAVGRATALYLRVVCDSSGSSTDPHAGLDLDAVTYNSTRTGLRTLRIPTSRRPGQALTARPVPSGQTVRFATCPGAVLEIFDSAGRAVQSWPVLTRETCLDALSSGLSPGVYVAVQRTGTHTESCRFVISSR